MILYDNKSILSLSCKCHGSVFPKASLIALPFVIAVATLKALVESSTISLEDVDLITDGSVYGAFSLVLSFTLVFRCQQAYQRYTASAKAMHTMSSEWIDAFGSLMSFKVSRKPEREKQQFEAVLVRLFCLLHACAMENLCNQGDTFKLLDIEAFVTEDLALLSENADTNSHMQIQYVFIWVKYLIIQGIDSGLLSIPPPILTRVYQEIGAGMAEFHDAQLISMWPFPFPYAQLSLFLSVLHLFLSSLIMVRYTSGIWAAATLTYISIVCVMSLNIIGVELENPFGEDTNDLPSLETHEEFRNSILALANPRVWFVPRTHQFAALQFETLKEKTGRRVSLKQHLNTSSVLELEASSQAQPWESKISIEGTKATDTETAHSQGAGAHGAHGAHGAQGAPGPAQAPQQEVLERWLSRQSAMLETFLMKQQALMEQVAAKPRVPEVKSPPSVFSPDGCCTVSTVRPRPLT